MREPLTCAHRWDDQNRDFGVAEIKLLGEHFATPLAASGEFELALAVSQFKKLKHHVKAYECMLFYYFFQRT